MAKRKITQVVKEEESELSSVPEQVSNGEGEAVNGNASKKRKTKADVKDKPTKAKTTAKIEEDAVEGSPKAKRKTAKKAVKDESGDEGEKKEKVTKKRKTKEEKEAEAMPIAARTVGHKLFIGAHVSSAGGVQNSVGNSVHIGANAFALFLKSQRKWANPPLSEDQCASFHGNCKTHSYEQAKHTVPHGSYLVNLAHTDKERTDQAYTSYLDDLKRCERLGISLYNIHPGNTVSNDRAAAISHLAKNINNAHRETTSVITLLENMAAGGNVLGSTFEDLRDIISLVDNKDRIGVCIDTCHAFAGGYDLRTPAAFQNTFDDFEKIVGFKYLRALHINDSKAPFDSHRDLHANIGTGFLGLRAFHTLVNDERFEGLPLILETPTEVRDENGNVVKDEKKKDKEDKGIWAREIKMLESFVGMDAESDEFKALETQLQKQGEPERNRLAEQQERKKEKEQKKAAPKGGKGKAKTKKASVESEEDDEAGSE
jgi:AP endonuclease-1